MRQDLHYKETLFFIQQSSILYRKVGLCVYSNIILPLLITHYPLLITHHFQELFPAFCCIFFLHALTRTKKRMPRQSGLGEQDR